MINLDAKINEYLYKTQDDIKLISFQKYVETHRGKMINPSPSFSLNIFEYINLSNNTIYYNILTWFSHNIDNFLTEKEYKACSAGTSFITSTYYIYPINKLSYIVYDMDSSSVQINCFIPTKRLSIFQYPIKLHKLSEPIISQKLNKKRKSIDELTNIPAFKGKINYTVFKEKFDEFYSAFKLWESLRAIQES